jgi:hypothetical protein
MSRVLCSASMRRLRSVAALLMFSALSAAAGVARAADHVAVLIPQTRPTAAPELRDRFHEAVTRGLQGGSDEITPAAEVRLRLGSSEELMSCAGSGSCVARAAQALRADKLVTADIDINGKDFAIKLRLVDAVGRELLKVEEPCDICTVKEAEEAVTRAATKLAAAARALPPDATAPPAKAETPPAKPEPPKVEPAPPKPEPKLEAPPPLAEPTPLATREKKIFPWRGLAIGAAVVGVVGLAIGIPLLAIDGNPTCSKPNPQQSCPEVYNTLGGGAAMLTLGLVSGAASGVFFYLDHRARKKPRAAAFLVLPSRDGVYLSAGGRF